MIRRRTFLVLATGAAAALGWRYHSGRDEDAIAAIVYKRLGYLDLDDAGVQRFAHDFAARQILSSRHLKSIAAFRPLYQIVPTPWFGKWGDRLKFAEDRVVSFYLISTDFFTNGSDPARRVQYQGFYDAMLHACGNPFRQAVQV